MAIKIQVANKVGVIVKGKYPDEKGAQQSFDFKLICNRLSDEAFAAKVAGVAEGTSAVDFMIDEIEDWEGVKDEDGNKVEYSPAAYRQLCEIPGVAMLAFVAYRDERGAKAKN